MVPSSPSGPWRRGKTIVVAAAVIAAEITGVGETVGPTGSRDRRGSKSPSEVEPVSDGVCSAIHDRSHEAIADSAMCHPPDLSIPIAVTTYRRGSSAWRTCAAVTQLTSCSAERPPKRSTTWMRSSPELFTPEGYTVRLTEGFLRLSSPAGSCSCSTCTSQREVRSPHAATGRKRHGHGAR